MLKRDYIISQLCGMVLIAIGVVGTLSIGFVAISSIKYIFFRALHLIQNMQPRFLCFQGF
jgi:hypothetical protein